MYAWNTSFPTKNTSTRSRLRLIGSLRFFRIVAALLLQRAPGGVARLCWQRLGSGLAQKRGQEPISALHHPGQWQCFAGSTLELLRRISARRVRQGPAFTFLTALRFILHPKKLCSGVVAGAGRLTES